MCDTISVMSQGATIEILSGDQLRSGDIKHRYTQQLLVASKGYDRAAIDQFQYF